MSVERRFEVGQKVRIVAPDSSFCGSATTIVAIVKGDILNDHDESLFAANAVAYETDIPDGRGGGFAYLASDLAPIDDDRFEVGSWSEVEKLTGWKPAGVSA